MTLPSWVESAAHFSDPEHRVWLRRPLGGPNGPAVFVLHNPSIANDVKNDPTANRGIGFGRSWGASDLVFVNAATGVATDADNLASMTDPIGSMADEALEVAAEFCRQRDGVLIAAWGAPKGKAKTKRLMAERFAHIRALGLPLHYLRMSSGGHPEHPLYLPKTLKPTPWFGVFS